MLRIVGILVEGKESWLYVVYMGWLMIQMVLLVLSSLIETFYHTDILVITRLLGGDCDFSLHIIKWILVFLQRKKLNEILKRIEKLFAELNTSEINSYEDQAVKEVMSTMKIHIKVYGVSTGFGVCYGYIFCMYNTLFNSPENWDFPYLPLDFLHVNITRGHDLQIIATAHFVLLFSGFLSVLIIDTTIICILARVTALFSLLKKMLGNIKEHKEYETVRRELDVCVHYHKEFLELVSAVEAIATYVFFSVFIINGFVLCFLLYICSMVSVTDSIFFTYCTFAVVIGSQIWFFCYWGDRVQESSRCIASEVFEIYQPHLSKLGKQIGLMLQRSQKPAILTAGKFTELSMQTFAAILQGSLSYFTFMRKMNEDYDVKK